MKIELCGTLKDARIWETRCTPYRETASPTVDSCRLRCAAHFLERGMKKTIIALFVLLLPVVASAQTTCVDRTGQVVMNGWKYTVQTAGTTTDRQRIAELERDGWTVTGFGGNGTSIRIYAKCKVDTPEPPPQPPPLPSLSIVCPPTQTGTAVDATGLNVTFPAPTASGGVAPVTITVSPASGSKFPVGGSVVTGRAVDAANQNATCTFTVTVAPPPPPPEPPPSGLSFKFANGWQNRAELGSTLNGLVDRDYSASYDRATAYADFGPAFNATNYPASIITGIGPRGTTSRLLQVRFLPDGTQNGPDFRITTASLGNMSDVYVRWWVKYSDNWRWAGADHKSMICGPDNGQSVYYNVRGNGNGGPGRVAIHVIPSDTVLSDYSTNMTPNVWHLLEIHIVSGTNGKIEARLDKRQLNLTVEAGNQVNPNNLNVGPAMTYCKIDTTYNAYSYPSGLGLTMYTWFDEVAIATGGWIGDAVAPGPVGAPLGSPKSAPRPADNGKGRVPPGDPATGPHRPVVRAEK